jgi:septum formation protein
VPVSTRVILASASPARLATLRGAGLEPQVVVSGVDETSVSAATVGELVSTLARRKAEAVSARWPAEDRPTVILGCDSLLELDGIGYGKPGTVAEATRRWSRMSGRSGILHTGHHLILRRGAAVSTRTRTVSTTVHFAELSPEEIDAYVATGEPLAVAGAFTIDGLGGAFVTRIEGDHHNVVGVSLPALRTMALELGLSWTSLWAR